MAVTLASAKAWMGITDAAHDAEIQALIDRMLYTVQLELDWYFGIGRPAEEILDGPGNRALWLRQPPLAGVTVRYRAGVGEDWEMVDADDYEADGRGLFHVGNWTAGVRNYRVNYAEGFVTMPGDIEQLILDLVSMKWQRRTTDPALKSERIGDYAYTLADLEESQYWTNVLMRWRRGRI